VVFIAYAYLRHKRVEEALTRGTHAPFETRVALVFAAFGMCSGSALIAILAHPVSDASSALDLITEDA
jgi:hypothetical protein